MATKCCSLREENILSTLLWNWKCSLRQRQADAQKL